MPKYFFHLEDDLCAIDEEGSEWASDDEAIAHAIEGVRDVASANVRKGVLDLNHFVRCVADDGRAVRSVRFGDAVKIEPFHDPVRLPPDGDRPDQNRPPPAADPSPSR